MEPENDPYRHAYLKAKATTNGIMHALFNWWLAFTLFNLVVVSLFLWAYDPIGRLNDALAPVTQTQKQTQPALDPSTESQSNIYEAPNE
ncbi:hypothetical protein [Ligilactobacillus murinus]|uniref:hypothetical protein n=1 Tax=Ligilactobacillus murinus TaxID=1622 RepID=UPI002DD61FF9|nr:hypothetical protein [Ligilactobacillus murinus]WRY37572.1 hypothetical protein P8F80_11265 [Ligilactobacillus murinus]